MVDYSIQLAKCKLFFYFLQDVFLPFPAESPQEQSAPAKFLKK